MSTDLSNAAPLLDDMENHVSKPSIITQQQAGCTLPLFSHCFSLFHATFEIQCGKACRCEDAWLVSCGSIEFRSTPLPKTLAREYLLNYPKIIKLFLLR